MKVAVYFATGYEEIEALSVVDILRRGKVEVLMVGVSGQTVVGAHNISINMDTTLEQMSHEDIEMMILPGGGLGARNLAASRALTSQLEAFKEQGKWLAAICAAPSVLGEIGLLRGEKATCYPGFEEKLLGCSYESERVVVSNHVITGVGSGASLEFGYKILELLQGKEVADKVKSGMLADL